MRLTFKQLQRIDVDCPRWILPVMAALIVYGGIVEASGNNPLVAVLGLVLIVAVVLPIRRRQLRRRIAAYEAAQAAAAAPEAVAAKVDKPDATP